MQMGLGIIASYFEIGVLKGSGTGVLLSTGCLTDR